MAETKTGKQCSRAAVLKGMCTQHCKIHQTKKVEPKPQSPKSIKISSPVKTSVESKNRRVSPEDMELRDKLTSSEIFKLHPEKLSGFLEDAEIERKADNYYLRLRGPEMEEFEFNGEDGTEYVGEIRSLKHLGFSIELFRLSEKAEPVLVQIASFDKQGNVVGPQMAWNVQGKLLYSDFKEPGGLLSDKNFRYSPEFYQGYKNVFEASKAIKAQSLGLLSELKKKTKNLTLFT